MAYKVCEKSTRKVLIKKWYESLLEALPGQWEASQLLLRLCKQEEVHGGEIWRVECVGDQRDGAGGYLVFDSGGNHDLRIVPAPNQCEEWSWW